ncbi:MAG TPA: hypothetical protein VHZ99_12070 [Steroidobacteraceae bacterium]|jgi:hypothetical protein|nr:hypothetical protein [Steroidobacteraceae bacterium]
MRGIRTWTMARHGLAALALLVLSGNSIAGALTIGASMGVNTIHSNAQTVEARPGYVVLPDAAVDEHISIAANATNSSVGTERSTFARLSRFETPIKWQSGLNIAGSRAWSKFLDLSPKGINVRLPLN